MGNCYNDCSEILSKFHILLNEAEELYEAADNIIDKEVINSIYTAIKSLQEAFELGSKGGEIETYANNFLNRTGCSTICSKDSSECKTLIEKADESFAIETENLNNALDSLNAALNSIKNSIIARKIGYSFRKKYKYCVHCKIKK